MNEPIHICSDACLGICSGAWPSTWPSGPVWDAFLENVEQQARADERAVIEAGDARRHQIIRETVHGITRPPRWAQFPDIREQAYQDADDARAAEQARYGHPVDLSKRTAA